MTDISVKTDDLQTKTDLDWFDSICGLLTKDNNPTVHKWTGIIGTEEPNPHNQTRGSKFFIPFDKRFDRGAINPVIKDSDVDRRLDYLSFWGKKFNLTISDIVKRFPNYKTQINIYDGGTQIFFYPIPDNYAFTAMSFHTDKEVDEIKNPLDIIVHSVTFNFGNKVILLRDGYTMTK
jgi:hypothetical protein